MDGLTIARQRVAREAEEGTGFLDLGRLGLSNLPDELFELKQLRRLNLGASFRDEAGQPHSSASDFEENFVEAELDRIAELPDLQYLSVSGTSLRNLARLQSNLQSLDCSHTQVRDLAPLKGLSNLQSLSCRKTEVSDLAALPRLFNLQSLDCSHTQVSDLAPLQGLSNLQTLDCSYTQISDLTPLRGLSSLQSLDCWHTRVSDLAPLKGLANLRSLSCMKTEVSDLAPLKGLANLQSLHCSYTQVSDLTPLKGLSNLQSLGCSGTQVSDRDLALLCGLSNLQSLNVSFTQISDLAPLRGLTKLQLLDCSQTQVTDLAPLKDLSNLQSLQCWQTPVRDLAPLQGLSKLQSLNCSVSDLAPLKGLSNLQSLSCFGTQLNDLAPLQGLANLERLYCSQTQVSDLTPLQGLSNLQSLVCSQTQVSDLAPLQRLTKLQTLDCSECRLISVPETFWFKPSLETLRLHQTHLPGIPPEVLSQGSNDNCLESLRAHLRDLNAGREVVSDVNLMVLGNGRIGKTQICRRLRGQEFDESVESTHGILVTSAPLPQSENDPVRLEIWDFGGQDIYLGTHALFMRSRAVFLLVWIPEAETTEERRHGGMVFRNRPLAYWLDYVKHFGGTDSPVLVVQTRCEQPEDEIFPPPVSAAALAGFPFKKLLQYSALLDRGRAALDEALHQAGVWLRERQGIIEIGVGRSRVKRRLEAMRDADASRSLLERRCRTITHEQFLELCRKAGDISSTDHLLTYLTNAGTVLHIRGFFEDRIIIDQAWVLEAIYTLFDREKCVKRLQRQKGRFTPSDLAEWLWDAAGYSATDQALFLLFMQLCGSCFAYRAGSPEKGIEAEYIAPDFLPKKSEIEHNLAMKWDTELPSESVLFEYSLLHPGLMRGIISKIGREAGLNADYWRGGVFAYAAIIKSRFLIEEETAEGWGGSIRASTQRGQAAFLLERLKAFIEDEQRRLGVTPTAVTETRSREAGSVSAFLETEQDISRTTSSAAEPSPLMFAQEPTGKTEYYVSYAWGDETPEGKEREAFVERLCAAAKARNIRILRDKTAIGLGEHISKFMQRLARGNRVFVVLSDKYLKSPNCMYELFELWRHRREDEDEFLSHVRVYTLPCAKIRTVVDRTQYAAYWKEEYGRLDALVKQHGADILGVKDFERYLLMKKFSSEIGSILATVTDILQPRNFEEFERYGFSETPSGDNGKV